jgi:hypothetical protein
MARPPILNPKRFTRTLTDEQLKILLAAGAGNTSDGFKMILDCYQTLYNAGVKDSSKLEIILARFDKIGT